MSYQAITDFLINPVQIQQDFRNLNTNQEISGTKSSSSFEDLISFYREMNETPANAAENSTEKTAPVQESSPNEKITEASVSDSAAEKSEKAENPALQDDLKDAAGEENPKITLKDFSEGEKESVNLENALPVEDDFELSATALNKAQKNEVEKTDAADEKKKLTAKEFSRMQSLTEGAETENAALVAENVLDTSKLDLKSEKKEKDADFSANVQQTGDLGAENESEALKNFVTVSLNGQENSGFSDGANEGAEKKSFFLDKDGKITVEDLRSQSQMELDAKNSLAEDKKSSLKVSELKFTDSNTAQITMDVADQAQDNVLSLSSQTAGADGSNFQAMLSNQIQSNASELVKAGNIVLKDNNQGTINLVLHPDDLGNVKIHLSLDGKTLTAHVSVTSKEALQVFKDNSETLREAFIKGGFDVSDFEVSYNNSGSSNQNMDFGNQNEQNNFVARHVYESVGGAANVEFENVIQKNDDFSNYSINIVA